MMLTTLPNTQNLHEATFQKLRALLVEGPIREAIRRLAADGLVELIANRGAIAIQLTREDIIHTFDVIATLEGYSGELAAKNISAQALIELEALQYEMMASYARRDLSNYYRLNIQIHNAINQAANNPVLQQLFSQVNARIEALRFRSNQNGVKWEKAVGEHQEMLDALKAHDSARMRKVMMQHVMNKRDVVIQLIDQETSQ
ncbi:MAG: GntR family transcriptional regulator [Polynucleobacter sp. 39-45-136]|nr:MAG: GntR family transcriptional regulator [Polynucleobacter sp. 39-45-136]